MKMDKAAYEKALLERIVASIEAHGGSRLVSAVILTGSFGRDEQTYVEAADGSFHLKSDVELGLVFPDHVPKSKMNTLIQAVSGEFTEDLNLMPISRSRIRHGHNFNFTLISPKYKTLFTYDLYHGSKTIWGQEYLNKQMVTLQSIDPYEGKRLVANRIGELLYLQQSDRPQLQAQWKGKLLLAIGSAWLLSRGQYVTSFRGQWQSLKAQPDAEEVLGTGFLREYEKVFRYLRQNGGEYDIPDALLRTYTANINRYFRAHIPGKPRVNSASRMAKYMIKYAKAGAPYGMVGFENRILQALLDGYCAQDNQQYQAAKLWHKVLY